MTWNDAQKYCREHYDDLSTTNKEEAEMLSIDTNSMYLYYWLGLYRSSDNPEKWIWSGGESEPADYWDIDQPNYDYECCGGIRLSNSKLHDVPCSETLPFYCMNVFALVLVHQNKTWDEALDYCRKEYTDLASLSSETTMEEGINKITTSQTAYVWTGLRFMSGHWFWLSGDDLQYKAWPAEGEIQCPAEHLRCGALDIEEKVWKPTDREERHNFLCLKKP
ncbi:lymphocyte antigen 75-like protein [Labeo rohita]|uniref:Lymphocyte antigen 75-like protein n=1 Tax=Labeo rohita TaxID=84645 RepID=A0A498M4X0_LABRO|nr:lymphocyte antigen 75-like protein [Labeo rohita]